MEKGREKEEEKVEFGKMLKQELELVIKGSGKDMVDVEQRVRINLDMKSNGEDNSYSRSYGDKRSIEISANYIYCR